jgi:hypothetical protein
MTDDEPRDDQSGDDEVDAATEPVGRPVDRFRRTGVGSVVAAGLLGLRDALEGRPEREETAIVREAPTAAPGDVEVLLDIQHPGQAVVVVHRKPQEGSTD